MYVQREEKIDFSFMWKNENEFYGFNLKKIKFLLIFSPFCL